jgi:transcriptional regulator
VVKLTGHLAKQNDQWQAFAEAESLAIFTGAHAYISPTLYEQRASVPTWNYIAVHAYGVPQIITLADTPIAMEQMIKSMVDTYEASYKSHWDSLSDRFRAGMMHDIVGFAMTVTRLEGKYKLSQNRSQVDQQTISETLLQNPDPMIHHVGAAMQQNLESDC